jgi:tetratricopeptide (TPR) repeat protein
MVRHPAEPYFPFVGAVRAIVVRDESVLPWAARDLERSPVYGRVHLLIARSLFVKNPSQARLEYRLACLQDSNLCYHDEALSLVLGYDDAMELVPDSPRAPLVLSRLAESIGGRLPATVVRLDRELSEREPGALGPVRRAAAAALQDVKNREPWCDEGPEAGARRCVADGLAAAQRLRAVAPDRCDGHALTAELRVASGDVDSGFAELDGSLDKVVDRSACARQLVTLAQHTGHDRRVDASLDRLLKLGCEAPPECVTNLTFAASVEASRGRSVRALTLTKKAWERAPERDDLLAEVGARAEAQGLHGEALEAYMKLVDRHPEDPKWPLAVAREREAVTRTVFQRR